MTAQTGAAPPSPVLVSIADWLKVSGMPRAGVYRALKKGDLRAKKLHSRSLIYYDHGIRWLNSLPDYKPR